MKKLILITTVALTAISQANAANLDVQKDKMRSISSNANAENHEYVSKAYKGTKAFNQRINNREVVAEEELAMLENSIDEKRSSGFIKNRK